MARSKKGDPTGGHWPLGGMSHPLQQDFQYQPDEPKQEAKKTNELWMFLLNQGRYFGSYTDS
jgi:hypothetical protein